MNFKRKTLLILEIIGLIVLAGTTYTYASVSEETKKSNDFTYLSDITYVEDKSFVDSEHFIYKDTNETSNLITVNVEGKKRSFFKGMCAWATSELVYDLRNYDYDYFTSYLGVDVRQQETYANNGVIFRIYVSEDGENWGKPIAQTNAIRGMDNSKFIKVNIKNAKYLKLVADENGDSWFTQWYDEAVYADAKLIKEGYQEDTSVIDFIKPVEEYDNIIKNKYAGQEITGDYELTLLQREFVNNVGYDILQSFVKYNENYKEVVSWLMNDNENLCLYIMGGKPDGAYIESLKVLSELYTRYKDDLKNETVTKNGIVLKDLYRKMMVSLSLTHSANCGLWAGGMTNNPNDPNNSNAVTRYEIYKKMHQEGKLDNKIFEFLKVEEMRFLTNNIIDDEEIEWINAYTKKQPKNPRDPYTYIKYGAGYDYNKNQYYTSENYKKWNKKYDLSKFNITYKKGFPKLWIVFEEGGVCGAISKTGSNIWGSYGVPSTVVHQPGHAAYIVYSKRANGDGVWNLYNDVSGWSQTGKTEKLTIRMPNGWGTGDYASFYSGSYILLAQAALNDFNNYEKAEKILLLANTYNNDKEKLNQLYREALKIQPFNFDAWHGLVELYKNDKTKTDEDYCNLAHEIADNLKYYPLPMYDLLRIIEPCIETVGNKVQFTLLRTKALKEASNVKDSDSIQANAVRAVANYLLGTVDNTVASFSFDGENAGSIMLAERFKDSNVRWEYSLNEKQTWTQTSKHKVGLTKQELESITENTDIYVHIVGSDYSDKNIFKIDIQKSATPNKLYNNDLENKIIGATDTMEWRLNSNEPWTSYKTKEPDLTGNKTVEVRVGKNGIYTPSDILTYNFTEDNQPDEQKYIPISHLSIHKLSSQQSNAEAGKNVIDGNIKTIWHSKWNGSDKERFIIIKLDTPVYLSALQYVPRQDASNGRIKSGTISVSMDDSSWTEVGTISNWKNDSSPKTVVFDKSVKAQYIKLQATQNHGDGRSFISGAMVNLFEDTTKKETPTASVEYNIAELTNKDVTAKLINASTDITITNNGGKDTYVFTKNGKFTFEFVDKYGNKGSTTATVNWIDKEAPTANIEYSTLKETSDPVIAKLVSNEEIIITNNYGKDSYTFNKNGTFEFVYQDKAGNIAKTTATVNWIKQKDENMEFSSEKYVISDNMVSRILPGTTIKEFKKNVETNQNLLFINKEGKNLEEDDILGTGVILKVGNTSQYEIVITGDLDGDGIVTVNDLAKLKLHYVEIENLEGCYLKAADIDNDGMITVNDIAQIKLSLINLIEIK